MSVLDVPYWISLDPGLRHCGLAIWHGTALVWAGLVKGPKEGRGPQAWATMSDAVHTAVHTAKLPDFYVGGCVVEYPQVYARGPGDPADLIELAGVVGAVVANLSESPPCEITGYLPREWKGQVPKEIQNARTLAKLGPGEKAAMVPCAASLVHNVWDAIGIGLAHLQKLGHRRESGRGDVPRVAPVKSSLDHPGPRGKEKIYSSDNLEIVDE